MFRTAVVFIASLIVSVTCVAQAPFMEPKPVTPDQAGRVKCFGVPYNPATGMCEPEYWDNSFNAQMRISAMLQFGRFDVLELSLPVNLDPKRLRLNGYPRADDTLNGIDLVFQPGIPGRLAKYGDHVKAWKAASPGYPFIALFEASQLRGAAWEARGSGYASTVSPEGWELYGRHLNAALETLDAAPAELKAHPAWHQLRLHIALDLEGPSSPKVTAIFAAATKAAPGYVPIYRTMARRMTPKWGAAPGDLEAFIAASTRQTKPLLGQALYSWLFVLTCCEVTPSEARMDWKKGRESFKELIKRFPEGTSWPQAYASFACHFRDRGAYADALVAIGDNPIEAGAWLSGYGHEVCGLWYGRSANTPASPGGAAKQKSQQ